MKSKLTLLLLILKNSFEYIHMICILGPAAMDIAWIGAGSADAYFHQGTTYLLIIIRVIELHIWFFPFCVSIVIKTIELSNRSLQRVHTK